MSSPFDADRILLAAVQPIDLCLFETITSTNDLLKAAVQEGKAGDVPLLFVADQQTGGRGRLGRTFASPSGTGLYMSLYIKTDTMDAALHLTLACAAAVCAAVEELVPLHPVIKWVNDVYLNGKKLCGILCEKVGEGVVCGIGINVRTPVGGFPPPLCDTATALDVPLDRSTLCGCIVKHLIHFSKDHAHTMTFYREKMFLIGHTVIYQDRPVTVTGVDDEGRLLVFAEDGKEFALYTGEVTLHGQQFTQ